MMPSAAELVRLARLGSWFDFDKSGTLYTHHDPGPSTWKRDSQPMGKGTFGTVFREECRYGPAIGRVRAVKVLQRHRASEWDHVRELEAVALFSESKFNANFVKSFGWYPTSREIFIYMEHAQFGDLNDCAKWPLPVGEVLLIASQVAEAMTEMHLLGYAHRDLKPANLLVFHMGPRWRVKIADFGLAVKGLVDWQKPVGTSGYMAPELLGLPGGYRCSDAKPADVWAFGVIIFLLSFGVFPRQDFDIYEQLVRKVGTDLARIPGLPGFLIEQCMRLDPQARSTMAAVYCCCEIDQR